MQNRKITVTDMLQVLFKREFYLDLLIMVFIAILPVLFCLFFILKLERMLGIRSFISFPYNLILFFIFFISGVIIIWQAYTYLVIVGEGSPNPQLGGTKRLVAIGPYSLVRHPSVIGKLLGIIGLGCLSKSVIFTFVIIPILFVGSAFYNRFIQEKGCIEKFGEEYLKYRKSIPMFIPKLRKRKLQNYNEYNSKF